MKRIYLILIGSFLSFTSIAENEAPKFNNLGLPVITGCSTGLKYSAIKGAFDCPGERKLKEEKAKEELLYGCDPTKEGYDECLILLKEMNLKTSN